MAKDKKKKGWMAKAEELAFDEDGDDSDTNTATLTAVIEDENTTWKVVLPVEGEELDIALSKGVKAIGEMRASINQQRGMQGYNQPPPQQYQQQPQQYQQPQYQVPQAQQTAAVVAPVPVPPAAVAAPQIIEHNGVQYVMADGKLVPLPTSGGTGPTDTTPV